MKLELSEMWSMNKQATWLATLFLAFYASSQNLDKETVEFISVVDPLSRHAIELHFLKSGD